MRNPNRIKARLATNKAPMPFLLSLGVVAGLIGLLLAWFGGGN